ncbi:MAG: hypothetical protein WCI71_11140, partial [Bacteroidota bacterium]
MISVSYGSSAFTISGNHLYETAVFVPTTGVLMHCLISVEGGVGHNITNNYLGGSGPSCIGTFTITTCCDERFYPIFLVTSGAPASNIQGNTIAGFNLTSSSSSQWTGIYLRGGTINVGTIMGNTIGSGTGNGSVMLTTGASGSAIVGIYTDMELIGASGVYTITGNIIGSLTTNCSNPNDAAEIFGILNQNTSSTSISANTIGSVSPSTTNSLYAMSAATGNSQRVIGIYSAGYSGSLTVTGTTIAKLTNGTTNTNALTDGSVTGISMQLGSHTISNNSIHDLTIANAFSYPAYAYPAAVGIYCSGVDNFNISGNTVYNISNTYNAFAGDVTGIYIYAFTGASTLSGNFIHNLSITGANSSTGRISGLFAAGGNGSYYNNIVSLGGNSRCAINGLTDWDNNNSNAWYFNSVSISGNPPSGATNQSSAMNVTSGFTGTKNIRNNLFVNTRSTSGGADLHFSIYYKTFDKKSPGWTGTLTSDYNDYYVSGTGGALGFKSGTGTLASLAAIQSATGGDLNSMNADPLYTQATGTDAGDYVPQNHTIQAVTGTGVLNDYDGTVRSVTKPAMGAYEISIYLPVTVIASSGAPTADYWTLKLAFDAINNGTHQGDITVKINSSTTESETAALYASGSIKNAPGNGGANYNSVHVYPTASGLSIAGNLAAPLIDLNGADNVTIDGRVNQAGDKNLIITNTSVSSTAGASTIRFINDACSNTVKYCNLKGSSLDPSGGVLPFSTTTGSTGNDNNTIDNNDITCSTNANRPVNVLYALGSSGKENSGNIISNNNFYNFMRNGANSYGIYLYTYNTAWTISGNSFYETSTFVPSASATQYYMMYIYNSGSNYSLTGNYIGGTAPLCGGTAFTKSSSPQYNSIFGGILLYLYSDAGTASSIQGNTISNMSWTNSGAASWRGIVTGGTGDVNIGTTAANTIGASTGNSSISYTCGATGASFYGMFLGNTGTTVVHDNIIGSVTATNDAAFATNIYGIFKTQAGTTTISNNTIGSTTTANSINATSASSTAGNAQIVYGIYSAGSGSVTINDNTVAKLTNGTTNTDISTAGLVNGIATGGGVNSISNNTVRDLTIANANNISTNTASVIGICQTSTTAAAQSITGNTIYNLSNTYTSFAGNVIGLYYNGFTTASMVSGNFIHSLSVTGASSFDAAIYGMKINGGATTYANNIISLGGTTRTTLYGIYETGASGNNNNLYYNTVYLSGNNPFRFSYAFYSAVTTNSRDIRNNIFRNARTSTYVNAPGSSVSQHYAVYFGGTGGVLTCDYNDYFVSVPGGMLGYYGSDKTALPIVT